MNIGSAIKKIRSEKFISQKKLAESTGISPTSLSQIEKGLKRPSAKNLVKICKALEVPETLIYFYGIEESDIPTKKKKIYSIVYPAIEDMIKKLILDD